MEAQEIIRQLKIEEDIVAIYPYGSHIYGTANEHSDHDYIIVAKPAVLNSGAFRNNAVSNGDFTIQGTLYSRAGFTDAINNYEMPAMECLSLLPEQVILKKWPFKIQKWDEKQMVQKVIEKASSSRHIADQQAKTGYRDRAQKGMFHALRILTFGSQLKEHQRIVDFSACNGLYKDMMAIDEDEFDTRSYYGLFDELKKKLES
ncbi:MAG: nucleotidyltransferase domain-containing protein [Nanoarchaeota archaeon]